MLIYLVKGGTWWGTRTESGGVSGPSWANIRTSSIQSITCWFTCGVDRGVFSNRSCTDPIQPSRTFHTSTWIWTCFWTKSIWPQISASIWFAWIRGRNWRRLRYRTGIRTSAWVGSELHIRGANRIRLGIGSDIRAGSRAFQRIRARAGIRSRLRCWSDSGAGVRMGGGASRCGCEYAGGGGRGHAGGRGDGEWGLLRCLLYRRRAAVLWSLP